MVGWQGEEGGWEGRVWVREGWGRGEGGWEFER